MSSLELKKQYITNQLRAVDEVIKIQEIYRKVLFDEETFSLKKGVPFNEEILEMCLNIPQFKLATIEIKSIIEAMDLETVEFKDIQGMIGDGIFDASFTQVYLKHLRNIEELKIKFSDFIKKLEDKKENGDTEYEGNPIDEGIKFFEDIRQKFCDF